MKTEQEIIETAKKLHDQLTEAYYERHVMTKEEFDIAHGQIWDGMEAELIAGGYRQPPVDYRELYHLAETHLERVDIIAEKLGLK